MIYPVSKYVVPAELNGVPNGDLPPEVLSAIKPYGQLYWKAACAWRAMLKAADADGLEFSHVGALRTLKEQVALFNSRYTLKATKRVPQVTRTYKGKTYFLKAGMAPAGSPGTSKHGHGCAIDVAALVKGKIVSLGASKKHVDWLVKNAATYGWSWEVADTRSPNFEIWHLICFNADRLAPEVLALDTERATRVKKVSRKEKKGRKA